MAWKKIKPKRRYHKLWSKDYREPAHITARILSEPKLGGLGSSVMYRTRNNAMGVVKDGRVEEGILPTVKHALPRHEFKDVPASIFKLLVHFQGVEPKLVRDPKGTERDKQGYRCTWIDPVPPFIRVIQRQQQQKTDPWYCMKLVDEPYLKIYMFFSGLKAYFLEEDDVFRTRRTSLVYRKARAHEIVNAKSWDKISWISKSVLPEQLG